jgi:hypothetical protein
MGVMADLKLTLIFALAPRCLGKSFELFPAAASAVVSPPGVTAHFTRLLLVTHLVFRF